MAMMIVLITRELINITIIMMTIFIYLFTFSSDEEQNCTSKKF